MISKSRKEIWEQEEKGRIHPGLQMKEGHGDRRVEGLWVPA